MQYNTYSKISLGIFPTPVQKLENISRLLNVNVFIKRDDLTGLGLGGNKVRKLEYLLADGSKLIQLAAVYQGYRCRTAHSRQGIVEIVVFLADGPETGRSRSGMVIEKVLGQGSVRETVDQHLRTAGYDVVRLVPELISDFNR